MLKTQQQEMQGKSIHCIGIGGIGVSALAELLLAQGCEVSGSDTKSNRNTQRLERLGAKIYIGHARENLLNPDQVIYSSAISKANPEYIAALEKNTPMLSRGEALAHFVSQFQPITVAGTHGKTTTTGIIAHMLMVAGKDPTYVVGGIINGQESPVYSGQGEHCVVEVDESDASFLYMQPFYGVVTNVDADHLETYGGDFATLQKCFMDYLAKIPADGAAIVCIDDPVIRRLVAKIKSRVMTYGFSEHADVRAVYFQQEGMQSHFNVRFADDGVCLPVILNLPGEHNVQNALAAIALAKELKLPYEAVCESLSTFTGMGRRFHCHGKMQLPHGQADIIEDYGHHPREIQATLKAAHLAWPDRRVVLVFQPHRYSRTRDLYKEFVSVLSGADKLLLLDVFSAGEDPLDNFSSLKLLEAVSEGAKVMPEYIADLKTLPEALSLKLQDGDVVLLQGAGSIGSVVSELV